MPTPRPSIALIGAPSDAGANLPGTSLGPDALRIAGIAPALRARGLHTIDQGNLSGPGVDHHAGHAPQQGFRHLAEVAQWNAAVCGAVAEALAAGHLPLLLGGDHSLAVGSISAVARHCRQRGQRLKVLWLDAHADANTPATSPSGNLHGMPVACLLGHGPQGLTHLAEHSPALVPAQLALLGVRSVDAAEKRFVNALGIEVYDMRYIDEVGMRATMAQALYGVDRHTHLHVSFDLDCLDPTVAPGVGTPVRGGPTYREIQLCMEILADCGALGSVDVLELNPTRDVRNQSAELAVDLLESLFGKSTLMRAR